MKVIWKYPLTLIGEQEVDLPEAAQILSVQIQGTDDSVQAPIALWALVDTEASIEKILIEMIGTGHEIGVGRRTYISTIQFEGGTLIFHVFKRENYGL